MTSIRLNTLGCADLTSDGTEIGSVVHQPKRFALLVYLTLESRTGPVRRDSVLSVFWPEQTEASARRSLNTALYFLRKELGEGVFADRPVDELMINHCVVRCDAVDLCNAADADPRAAAELYKGELLPGFYVDHTPEFQDWLDRERDKLRRLATQATWRCAELALESGDAFSAVTFARRAAELAHGCETMVRRQIELLLAIGDREGACHAFDDLKRRLAEYDTEPDPHTTQLLAAPERIAPAVVIAPFTHPLAGAVPASAAPARVARQPWWKRYEGALTAAATMAFVGVFVSLFGLIWGDDTPSQAPQPSSVFEATLLVEPVDVVHPSVSDDNGSLLGLELISELNSVMGFKTILMTRQVAPPDHSADATPSYAVRVVIAGDTTPRVVSYVLDSDGAILGEDSWPYEPDDADSLMASTIVDFVRTKTGAHANDRTRWAAGISQPARRLIRVGVIERERGDSLAGADRLSAALNSFNDADNLFAEAGRLEREWSEPARQQAETALRRMAAHISSQFDQQSVLEAIRGGLVWAEKAVQIEPEDVAALEVRALLKHYLWQFSPPRAPNVPSIDELIAGFNAVLQRDPLRVRSLNRLSSLHFTKGEFEEALSAAQRAYDRNTFLGDHIGILARLYESSLETGDLIGAKRWCNDLASQTADSWVTALCKLHIMGWQTNVSVAEARAATRIARNVTDDGKARVEMVAAVVNAAAGLKTEATALIDQARTRASNDGELLAFEAWARLRLGERDTASALLKQYIEQDPRRFGMLRSKRFAALASTYRLNEPQVAVK